MLRWLSGALGLLLLGGCGGEPAPDGVRSVSVSRTRAYRSVTELRGSADLVVVGRATANTTVEWVGEIPFTVTDLTVEETFRGTPPGGSIRVRQVGSAARPLEGGTLLAAGTTYLLFLRALPVAAAGEPRRYSVVGVQAGLFRAVGPDEFEKTDADSPDLPARISRAAVR